MLYIIIFILAIVLDRITKILALKHLTTADIDLSLINLTFVKNKGAAFGILQNQRIFFIIFTFIVFFILIYYFIKNTKKIQKNKYTKYINMSIVMVISGAMGNFYDRIVHHYVIDFIDIKLFNFPVFNISDIFVSVGCVLMIIFLFLEEKYTNEHKIQ